MNLLHGLIFFIIRFATAEITLSKSITVTNASANPDIFQVAITAQNGITDVINLRLSEDVSDIVQVQSAFDSVNDTQLTSTKSVLIANDTWRVLYTATIPISTELSRIDIKSFLIYDSGSTQVITHASACIEPIKNDISEATVQIWLVVVLLVALMLVGFTIAVILCYVFSTNPKQSQGNGVPLNNPDQGVGKHRKAKRVIHAPAPSFVNALFADKPVEEQRILDALEFEHIQKITEIVEFEYHSVLQPSYDEIVHSKSNKGNPEFNDIIDVIDDEVKADETLMFDDLTRWQEFQIDVSQEREFNELEDEIKQTGLTEEIKEDLRNILDERHKLEMDEYSYVESLKRAAKLVFTQPHLKQYYVLKKHLKDLEKFSDPEIIKSYSDKYSIFNWEVNQIIEEDLQHVGRASAARREVLRKNKFEDKKVRGYWNILATKQMKTIKRVCSAHSFPNEVSKELSAKLKNSMIETNELYMKEKEKLRLEMFTFTHKNTTKAVRFGNKTHKTKINDEDALSQEVVQMKQKISELYKNEANQEEVFVEIFHKKVKLLRNEVTTKIQIKCRDVSADLIARGASKELMEDISENELEVEEECSNEELNFGGANYKAEQKVISANAEVFKEIVNSMLFGNPQSKFNTVTPDIETHYRSALNVWIVEKLKCRMATFFEARQMTMEVAKERTKKRTIFVAPEEELVNKLNRQLISWKKIKPTNSYIFDSSDVYGRNFQLYKSLLQQSMKPISQELDAVHRLNRVKDERAAINKASFILIKLLVANGKLQEIEGMLLYKEHLKDVESIATRFKTEEFHSTANVGQLPSLSSEQNKLDEVVMFSTQLYKKNLLDKNNQNLAMREKEASFLQKLSDASDCNIHQLRATLWILSTWPPSPDVIAMLKSKKNSTNAENNNILEWVKKMVTEKGDHINLQGSLEQLLANIKYSKNPPRIDKELQNRHGNGAITGKRKRRGLKNLQKVNNH